MLQPKLFPHQLQFLMELERRKNTALLLDLRKYQGEDRIHRIGATLPVIISITSLEKRGLPPGSGGENEGDSGMPVRPKD